MAAMGSAAPKLDALAKLQTAKREEFCSRLRTFLRKDKMLTEEVIRGATMKQRLDLAEAFLKADSPGGPAGNFNGSYFWNRDNTAGSMDYKISISDATAIQRCIADFIRKDYAIKPAKPKKPAPATKPAGPPLQKSPQQSPVVIDEEDPLLLQALRKAAVSNERLERADSSYAASESDHVVDTNRQLRYRDAATLRLGLSSYNLSDAHLSDPLHRSPRLGLAHFTQSGTLPPHDDDDSLFVGSPWSPAEDIPHTPRTPPPSENRLGKRKATDDDGSSSYPTPSGNDMFDRSEIRPLPSEMSRPTKIVRVRFPPSHLQPAVTNIPAVTVPASSPLLVQTSTPSTMGPPPPSDIPPSTTANENVETEPMVQQEAFNPSLVDFTRYLSLLAIPAQSPVSDAPPMLARGTDLVQSGARLYRISDLASLQEENIISLRRGAVEYAQKAKGSGNAAFGMGQLAIATLFEDLAFEFERRARGFAYRANSPRQ